MLNTGRSGGWNVHALQGRLQLRPTTTMVTLPSQPTPSRHPVSSLARLVHRRFPSRSNRPHPGLGCYFFAGCAICRRCRWHVWPYFVCASFPQRRSPLNFPQPIFVPHRTGGPSPGDKAPTHLQDSKERIMTGIILLYVSHAAFLLSQFYPGERWTLCMQMNRTSLFNR